MLSVYLEFSNFSALSEPKTAKMIDSFWFPKFGSIPQNIKQILPTTS